LPFIIRIFHKFISEVNPNNSQGKSPYLILRDVSQVRAMNDPCNFIGDIFSQIVNRNGLRIQSTSVQPESDSFKTPIKNSEEGKNTTFNLFGFVWALFGDIPSY
jgi:hypothetical protein